jgi:cyclophilin family peptidyl-prolyl cis-trans isomerase
VLPLLDDPVPNVQVQAAETLGDLGGSEAVEPLSRIATADKGTFARRREALLALAALDTRATAAEGWARVEPARAARLLLDRDPRVVAAALQAWAEGVDSAAPDFVTACRRLLTSQDAAVRSVAADGVARAADPADIPALVSAYQAAARDSFPEAALSALGALVAIGRSSPEVQQRVDRDVLAQLTPPTDYVIRQWAEANWPEAARIWGDAHPINTGRTLQDYRDVARRFLVGLGPERYPRVKLEVDQLGTIELELFGPEAPLTVANFLRLVDRRFFDGLRFHRVVPNFVVQAGDPRGDGWGGPGTTIRDEINRRRYGAFVLGMALSGPDTGGSQWFITLGPQPHLDGKYTVFGRVVNGWDVLDRLPAGETITRVRVWDGVTFE